jgi:hypothetical protein
MEYIVLNAELPKQYLFCSFAVETLGFFGQEALELVLELGIGTRLRATTTGEAAWLFQRISVAIQRGNSATSSIFATIHPTSKTHTDDDFIFNHY